MKRPICLCFLFCCLLLRVRAQQMAFEQLTVDNGLSQNSVLAVAQDYRGFIWIGTRYGLNKYNSISFKAYQNNPADTTTLSSNYITALLVDSRHTLWIGTRNGLNRYHPETDSFERIVINHHATEAVSCIYEDHQHNIWIWSSSGLNLLTTNSPRFTPISLPETVAGLGGINTRTIYQDEKGTYWLGTSAGLTRMEFKHSVVSCTTYTHEPGNPASLSDSYVTTIAQDARNNLWIGTMHGGLNRFIPASQSFIRFLNNGAAGGPVNNNIRKIRLDRSGHLWVGTQGGLSIVDPDKPAFTSYRHDPENKNSLSHNSIYEVFIDKDNTAWIGTYWGGINKLSIHNTTFLSYQERHFHSVISNNVVSAIVEDKLHNLWLGTEGGGLNYFDRKNDVVTTYQNNGHDAYSLGTDLIKVIYIDLSGNVWVGTHGGGLNLFNPARHNFTRLFYKENDPVSANAEILSITEDRTGIFWLGTQTGLYAFTRSGTTLTPVKKSITTAIAKRSVNAILEDSTGHLWIGTNDALYQLDERSNRYQVFNHLQGSRSVSVNCLFLDSGGRLWLGADYGGLGYYDNQKQHFLWYNTQNGLPNNNVLGILEDDRHNLWVSTGNGLSKFNIKTHAVKTYTKSDGLGGNTFNVKSCLKTRNGEMFFGGFSGLISFQPDHIEENNTVPPVIITGLRLFNKPVAINDTNKLLKQDISLTSGVVFAHAQNVFTIEFAALNYIKSEKNHYAYRLEGYDKDWVYTPNPAAAYTNVPPGHYTFYARGANNDDVWGEAKPLAITVLPAFWATIWAYILYALVLAGLLFLIIRYFILRSLLRKDQQLTRLKLNFFTNVSHEIRTHLSLIFGPVEKLLLDGKVQPEQLRQLQLIKNNSDSLIQLVNELMDFRRAETGNLKLQIAESDIVTLLRHICHAFTDQASSRDIKLDFVSPSPAILLHADRVQLEKVFFNLLHNAFKFTPAGGHISIIIEEFKNEVSITIADNGKGIAPENLKNLFENYFQENDEGKQNTGYGIGLALSKSIIERHHGTISVESRLSSEGNYTAFKVSLLKGSVHFGHISHSTTEPYVPAFNTVSVIANNAVADADWPDDENQSTLKPRVLIVEDNHELITFFKSALQKEYLVDEAVNGLQGLEIARQTVPDLVISDVMMPGMNGLELCNDLKTDERTSHIPVMLLTARTASAEQVEGLKVGADIYLTKPVSIEVLLLQIHNLLAARERIRHAVAADLKLLHTAPPANAGAGNKVHELVEAIDQQFLDKVIKIIETNLDQPEFSVAVLANEAGMSLPVLYRKINALTGLSVNEFIKRVKMNNAAALLTSKRYNVTEIAYMVGFSDRKYFSKEFKKMFGKLPSDYVS